MQNRYTGDIGDYGKYGLLRYLIGETASDDGTRLSLGVAWYLFPDSGPEGDGKHTRYLCRSHAQRQAFRECDPPLYDALAEIVRDRRRCVASVEADGILPGTTYHSDVLSYDGIPMPDRVRVREQWLQAALDATVDRDMVFIDPDNGIETPSRARYDAEGPKHVYLDDLRRWRARDQTLVIYHHLQRHRKGVTGDQQMAEKEALLREELAAREVVALRFHRGTARAFIIVPAPRHVRLLRTRVADFCSGAWAANEHFSQFED
ncbi:MAG TPA: hypothetical protein QGH10_13775 [Armatimonadota bacterium]|nr:hypothetical protein [Armatimonadota bacterium]